MLQFAKVLAHYDVNLLIKLTCDASSYAIGAVLSHLMPGGEERPVAFASRTLSASEKNYAQLEKEALSIIYGVKKFREYLFGRKFTLETDHKPLLTILGPKSAVPALAAARLQRWALILASYHYEWFSAKQRNIAMLMGYPGSLRTKLAHQRRATFSILHM